MNKKIIGLLTFCLFLAACASQEENIATEPPENVEAAELVTTTQEDTAELVTTKQEDTAELAATAQEDATEVLDAPTQEVLAQKTAAPPEETNPPAPEEAAPAAPQKEAPAAPQKAAPKTAKTAKAASAAPKVTPRSDSALLASTVANECEPGATQQCLADLGSAAEQAINTANAAGAEIFSSAEIAEAQKSLAQGQSASDNESKRQLYLAAAQQAQEAHQKAIAATEEQLLAALTQLGSQLANYLDQQLTDLNVALYMPEAQARAQEALDVLRSAADPSLDAPENAKRYQDAAIDAKAIITALAHNLAWLEDLEKQVLQLQSRTESQRPNEALQQAAASLTAAQEAKEQGQLSEAESNLFAARQIYQDVLSTLGSLNESLLDRSIVYLQENLEESAQYSSIGEDGSEYPASNWSAADFLAANPLLDLQENEDASAEPQSRLQQPQYASAANSANSASEATEDIASIEASGDIEDPVAAAPPQTPPEFFQRAVGAWQEAVQLRNMQDMIAAVIKLEEAKIWLEQYRSLYAVQDYYEVRENIDSLWTIAGYETIYDDPFQWRRIYNRNSEIIDNPRLIYPNQRLLIPPPRLP